MTTLKQTNKFSVQRFALILRYTFRSKACIHSAAISAAMLLLSLMIAINNSTGAWGMEHFYALNSLRHSILMAFVFSALLSASQAFAGLWKKKNCISEVMLPANASEKFLSRIIICIATCVVVTLAMYLVAFGILAALSKSANEMAFISNTAMAQRDPLMAVYTNKGYDPFCEIISFNREDVTDFIIAFTTGLSIFALGGTVWKEKALIIMPVIVFFLIQVLDCFNIDKVTYRIIYIIVAIVCWWLTWRTYSRMQCSAIKISSLWHLAKNKIIGKS